MVFLSGDAADVAAACSVGLKFLRIMGVGMSMLYTVHFMRSFVQGLGHAGLATAASVCELAARLASVFLLGAVLGTDCVLYAETLAWIAGAVITTIGAVYYARRLKMSGL